MSESLNSPESPGLPDSSPDRTRASRLRASIARWLSGRKVAIGAGGLGLLGLVWLAGARAEAPVG